MWLPNAEVVAGNSAGNMNGDSSYKLLLHSTEGSTIEGAVGAYRTNNSWPTLTVACRARRIVEHLDLLVAARALRNAAGGVETNRDGTVLVQIELVGFAGDPASIGSPEDLDWLGRMVVRPICELTGVPLISTVHWAPYPASYGFSAGQRLSGSAWDGYSGLLGHQHAPENTHGDPGAIDINRILAAAGGTQEDDMLDANDRIIIREECTNALKLMTRHINGVGGGKDADAEWARWVYQGSRDQLDENAAADKAQILAAVGGVDEAVVAQLSTGFVGPLADRVVAAIEAKLPADSIDPTELRQLVRQEAEAAVRDVAADSATPDS